MVNIEESNIITIKKALKICLDNRELLSFDNMVNFENLLEDLKECE